jgi:type IV pilus assembly protein PilE
VSTYMKPAKNGFTLIEVMITVAIIGILMAVAYPSYLNHILRSNRTAAEACLTELSQFMERSYTSTFSYQNIVLPDLACMTDLDARYTFSLTNQAARTYTANATPIGLQLKDDCGTLVLNQAGAKGANGGFDIAEVRRCW